MNNKIQQNLEKFYELAKKGNKASLQATSESTGSHEGLTKGIRNKEDAAIFMAELNAITELK